MRPGAGALVQRPPGRILPTVTPEGVGLQFELARAGDRLGAFLLDSLFMFILMIVLIVLAVIAAPTSARAGGWLVAFMLLAVFLLQTFYFMWFELRGRGMTPGKKRLGIRVMDAHGGTLDSSAVVVRNLVRNIEFYLPLTVVFAPEALWPSAPGWARLVASLWAFALLAMPLFNWRRLRVGDMVAGTMVVLAPRARLLGDLERERAVPETPAAQRFEFSEQQLDVYGAYELQVLEDVLRRPVGFEDERHVLRAVADRIVRKVGWEDRIARNDVRPFLLAFYGALRARLEQKMLFGKRKKDKYSREE